MASYHDKSVKHLAPHELIGGWILNHGEDRSKVVVADPRDDARGALGHRVTKQGVDEFGILSQQRSKRSVSADVAPLAEQEEDEEEGGNIRVGKGLGLFGQQPLDLIDEDRNHRVAVFSGGCEGSTRESISTSEIGKDLVWRHVAVSGPAFFEQPYRSYRRFATGQRNERTSQCRPPPTSARGAWSGRTPFRVQAEAGDGPLAALTRATIRPRSLLRFWKREPGISAVIGSDPNVAFKIGIGEVPWLHQVTFSIWPDQSSMNAFARGGPHARAIRAVRDEGWFREELYARFRVEGGAGSWGGQDPLLTLQRNSP